MHDEQAQYENGNSNDVAASEQSVYKSTFNYFSQKVKGFS